MTVETLLGLDDARMAALAATCWPRWEHLEPRLARVPRPARVAAWRRYAAPREANGLLLGLARLAAFDGEDDPDAALVLAWLLLPTALRVRRQLSGVGGDVDGRVGVGVGDGDRAAGPAGGVLPAAPLGLAAAASAELGDVEGWRRGSRGPVLIERRLGDDPVPPAATTASLTILDADAEALRPDAVGWLPTILATRPPIVLVTRPTVPALRRLETCLSGLADPSNCLIVTVGPPVKRWPRTVRHSLGVLAGELARAGRLVAVPEDRRLAHTGPTPDPLPAPLITAAHEALTRLLGKEPS